jgi:plasmid replication initiation protein
MKLTFVGRGTSARDYDRLKAGLDRPEPFSSLCITYSAVCPFARRRPLSR